MSEWFPASWQRFSCEQLPTYPDQPTLKNTIQTLEKLPSLVMPNEILQLKHKIQQASKNQIFILQGGDCAESFQDCTPQLIANKLRILKQMGLILRSQLRKPIVYVGRIAGQYTKPRSSEMEERGDVILPSYRGDFVNGSEFNATSRRPDPERLLKGYGYAAITLNFIRAMLREDFIGEFYISHEALHLHYEQALTRYFVEGGWYDLSTHFPWIGMRTAYCGSAQVEFLRGVQNPIGIKLGLNMQPDALVDLVECLNPLHEEGRLVLITRLGAGNVEKRLPALMQAVKLSRCPVAWFCDPMHGNTEVTKEGIKTRHFDTILQELVETLNIHHLMGSHLSGVHLELTGENVTECLGGPEALNTEDLKRDYQSRIDPRLNHQQSLDIARKLSQLLMKVVTPV